MAWITKTINTNFCKFHRCWCYLFPFGLFLHIKHLHSNIKPIVTRHIHILTCLEKKQLQTKKIKKEQYCHTCSKNNLVENMNTNSPKWKICSYIEYRISFTTLSLQKLVKNCWIKVHQIFRSKWCNVARSVAEK